MIMPNPIPPQAPPAVPPDPARSSAPGPQAEISAAQAETMIGWFKEDLLAGKITPEAAAKAFDQLGATPEQRAPDTRTDDQNVGQTISSGHAHGLYHSL